ncbi:MAG: leucine-rich repeat domain-containing protein [Bacteroidota bacterium]|nr:leucine-rich repeat domain-containing protein [Candidatus Kapabacteria bacterium]MDW8220501.1 leucine-rich repeat domain-containing protein [Bacteroidota bacterium]
MPTNSTGTVTLRGAFGQTESSQRIQFALSRENEYRLLVQALETFGLSLLDVIVQEEGNHIVGIALRPGRMLHTSLSLFAEKIAGLRALRYLDLSFAGLVGRIPPTLGQFTQLEYLNLSNNALSGEIAEDVLCTYPNIRVLNLAHNCLEGEIPRCITLLHNARIINLSHNRFHGGLHKEFGIMPHLEELYVQHNQLSGTLSPEFGTEEGAHVQIGQKAAQEQQEHRAPLRILDASNNQFTGSIPVEWGSMTKLQFLNLSHNRLGGELPASIGKLAKS